MAHKLLLLLSMFIVKLMYSLTSTQLFSPQEIKNGCKSLINQQLDYYLYTYEALEKGCTVNCYWIYSRDHVNYLDATLKRTYFNNGKYCGDSYHTCTYGRCVDERTEKITVTGGNVTFSSRGRVVIEFREGFFHSNDDRSKGDPFLMFLHGTRLYKTKVKRNSWFVNYNEEFNLPNPYSIDDVVKIFIMDRDTTLKDDEIGRVEIKLRQVLESGNNGKFTKYQVGRQMDWLEVRVTWFNI